MPHVFISYVRENSETVRRLRDILQAYGSAVWLDKDQLRPGRRWEDEIRVAISEGAFFIACFSTAYNERSRTFMNEELTFAIEELRQRPTDQSWFIPVLLDDCEVPNRNIGGGETLRALQRVNLHENWNHGVHQLLSVIHPQSAKIYELIQDLSDDSARVRIGAADGLGKLGFLAKQAVAALTNALGDDNATVRAVAADALGKIGEPYDAAVSKLLEVMRKGEYYSSRHAANALAKLGARGVPALVEATTYKEYEAAAHAADALALVSDPKAVPLLMEFLKQGLESAAESLGNIGDPIAVSALVEALSNESPIMRAHAARALGLIGDPSAMSDLEKASHDQDDNVRKQAAEALEQMARKRS